MTDDDTSNYSLKHHSTLMKTCNTNSLSSSSSSTTSNVANQHQHQQNSTQNVTNRPKKIAKTANKQPSISHFPLNTTPATSSFDPYYNTYPSTYVSSYPADVTTASFLEAAATTNYTSPNNNPNDLLLTNETNPYSGTYSNYYAAALQQQYQNSLAPYHAVYYQDTNNRYYPNHRTSPTINETTYHSQHHHQQAAQAQATHENYLIDANTSNNAYSYYLYNKTPSVVNHGHDSNNNLSLFDVSLSSPIHHSVIKHCTKR
jgi:hypothetical protein